MEGHTSGEPRAELRSLPLTPPLSARCCAPEAHNHHRLPPRRCSIPPSLPPGRRIPRLPPSLFPRALPSSIPITTLRLGFCHRLGADKYRVLSAVISLQLISAGRYWISIGSYRLLSALWLTSIGSCRLLLAEKHHGLSAVISLPAGCGFPPGQCPQSRIKSALSIASICTTGRQILARASMNHGPGRGVLVLLSGRGVPRPRFAPL